MVDPFTPPLPAKVTADQALHFAESLARGEPNRDKIALTALSGKLRELIDPSLLLGCAQGSGRMAGRFPRATHYRSSTVKSALHRLPGSNRTVRFLSPAVTSKTMGFLE